MNTTDLCDALDRKARVLEADWRDYGGRRAFEGPAATVVAPEDNSLVRQALEEPGRGRVLVVDGGGSRRCALVGGQLGVLAVRNGWAGIVVFGCVRDSVELAVCDVGIKALGTNPRKSDKKGRGEREASLFLGGAPISPGEWICADEDGVVVTAEKPGA